MALVDELTLIARPTIYDQMPRRAPAQCDARGGWSDDRVATLRKLWAEGLSASQIAKQLGQVSRNAVIGKVHRLGLCGRATPSRPAKRQVRAARQRAFPSPPRAVLAPAPRPPSPPPLAPLVLEDGKAATVLSLTDSMCRFPIGDPDAADFAFCGRGRDGVGSYCAEHHRLAYQVTAKKRRARPSAHDQHLAQLEQLMRSSYHTSRRLFE